METNPTPDVDPNQPVDENELPNADRLLSAYQVAELLHISRSLTYLMLNSGEIPTVRFRGSVRVKESDLEAFIQTHKTYPRKRATQSQRAAS